MLLKGPREGYPGKSTALLFKSVLCLVKRLFLTYTVVPVECWCSQSQVSRACTGEQRKNFAKLSLNLKLMETVHRGRERIKIQNKQHISEFV